MEEEFGKRDEDPRHGGDNSQPMDEVPTEQIVEDEDHVADLFMDEGIDIDSVEAREEDAKIVYHALLGHDLTESYSNGRLQLAKDRNFVKHLASVDMSEIFSPERVTKLCSDYGLKP